MTVPKSGATLHICANGVIRDDVSPQLWCVGFVALPVTGIATKSICRATVWLAPLYPTVSYVGILFLFLVPPKRSWKMARTTAPALLLSLFDSFSLSFLSFHLSSFLIYRVLPQQFSTPIRQSKMVSEVPLWRHTSHSYTVQTLVVSLSSATLLFRTRFMFLGKQQNTCTANRTSYNWSLGLKSTQLHRLLNQYCQHIKEIKPKLWVISGFDREVARSALFWRITRRRVLISYRRFGTTYQPLQESRNDFLALEDGTNRLSRNVGKELPL